MTRRWRFGSVLERVDRWFAASAGLMIVTLCCAAAPASAALSDRADDLPAVDGTVSAVARTADTIYIGGNFTQVVPRRGPLAQVSPTTGGLVTSPEVSGASQSSNIATATVKVVISDGAGGEYIGGTFTNVGGLPRNNAAHVLADGTVDPAWDPNVNDRVSTMVKLGDTVYLGGTFTTVNGTVARHDLAAVDAATGVARAWNTSITSPEEPTALAAGGHTVYARAGALFGLDATTGATLTTFEPAPEGTVYAMAVVGSTLYVGGLFHKMGGYERANLAAIDATTGNLITSWTASVDGIVRGMAVSGNTLYVVGGFSNTNSTARAGAAAFDLTTGATLAWAPQLPAASPGGTAVAVLGSTVYLSGIGLIGGVDHNGVAAVDPITGAASDWTPRLKNGTVSVVDGKLFLLGGTGSWGGGAPRKDLAAFDAANGHLLPWDPAADGPVNTLTPTPGGVIVGGAFSHVGGSARSGLARLDATTGVADLWNPGVSGSVFAAALTGQTLYVGGGFSSVGGATRHNAAAIDVPSAGVLPWDPEPDNLVVSIASAGTATYLGGTFQHLGPQPQTARAYAAAVDGTTGVVLPWTTGVDGIVDGIAIAGNTAYLAGGFSTPRPGFAAFDAATGAVAALDLGLGVSAHERGVAVDGSTATVIGASATEQLDTATGTVGSWDPGWIGYPDDTIGGAATHVFTDGRGGVMLAGSFTTLGQTASVGFASFSAPPTSTGKPAITGSPVVGQMLTCGDGAWAGSIPQSRSYQWVRGGAPIGGATANTYVAAAADAGQTVGCRVTSSNLGGAATVGTDAVSVSAAPAAGPTPVPVTGIGPVPDTTKPVLSALALTPSSFLAARAGDPIAAAAVKTTAKKKAKATAKKTGTAVTYRVSERSTVAFTVQRSTAGLKSGKVCTTATAKLRKAHATRCTFYKSVAGSFTRNVATAGIDTFTFSGRLGGKTLAKASYRLTLTATDAAGNVSVPVVKTFKVTGKA